MKSSQIINQTNQQLAFLSIELFISLFNNQFVFHINIEVGANCSIALVSSAFYLPLFSVPFSLQTVNILIFVPLLAHSIFFIKKNDKFIWKIRLQRRNMNSQTTTWRTIELCEKSINALNNRREKKRHRAVNWTAY